MVATEQILVVDEDPQGRAAVVASLRAGGIRAEGVANREELLAVAPGFHPQLLLVRAELGSDALGGLMAFIRTQPALNTIPLVLLSDDASESRFLGQVKEGIVELLKLPFNTRLYGSRLRMLIRELPDRTDRIRGKGSGAELAQFVRHLQRAFRSGELSVLGSASGEASLIFINGQLKSASCAGMTGKGALDLLWPSSALSWTFSCIGLGEDGGRGLLIDMDEEAPGDDSMVVTNLSYIPLDGSRPPEGRFEHAPAAAAPRAARSAPLPVPAASSLPAPSPPPAAQPVAATSTPPVGNRLLLVDDDKDLGKMFSIFFTKKGYQVKLAGDGAEAFQQALSAELDLVIADLNMPRFDGWGLLRLLREDFRTHELPVALFSCHDDYRDALRALHAGASAYYPKSLRMEVLEGQVRELLEPRERFRRILQSGLSLTVNIGALGPQWVVRRMAEAPALCQLDAQDSWASYRVGVSRGQLSYAWARAAGKTLEGEAAFSAFLTSRQAEGSLIFPSALAGNNLDIRATAAVEQATAKLNENQKRARDAILKDAKGLDINSELYQLYARVGPRAWTEIAKLLCENRLGAREVMKLLDLSLQDFQAAFLDLMRRGVITPKS